MATIKYEFRPGLWTRINLQDFEEIRRMRGGWRLDKDGYVVIRRTPKGTGKRKVFTVHRLVAKAKTGEIVDHINGDKLDNRRVNLRIVTAAENRWNTRKIHPEGKYIGVVWHAKGNKWRAEIWTHNKRYGLGYWGTAEIAALAYDKKCLELRGEFAVLNFPEFWKK